MLLFLVVFVVFVLVALLLVVNRFFCYLSLLHV